MDHLRGNPVVRDPAAVVEEINLGFKTFTIFRFHEWIEKENIRIVLNWRLARYIWRLLIFRSANMPLGKDYTLNDDDFGF